MNGWTTPYNVAPRPLWYDLLLWALTLMVFGYMFAWAVRANLRRMP
jgi:hypothetical protein